MQPGDAGKGLLSINIETFVIDRQKRVSDRSCPCSRRQTDNSETGTPAAPPRIHFKLDYVKTDGNLSNNSPDFVV